MEILHIVDVRFMDSQILNVTVIKRTWEKGFPSEITALVKDQPYTIGLDSIC